MTEADKPAFFTLLAMTAEAYDVPAMSKARLVMMFDDLSEYRVDEIAAALKAHRKTCKWFPKVSEIIERIRPDNAQAAMLAWSTMLPLLRNSRAARSSDPLTEAVVRDLGGWIALGQKSAAELVWVEKEFARRYETYAEHGVDAAEKVPQIAGDRRGLQLISGAS